MKALATLVLLTAAWSTAMAQATFHGNLARTGVYEGGGPTQTPAVKWTFKAAGPIVTSPAVKPKYNVVLVYGRPCGPHGEAGAGAPPVGACADTNMPAKSKMA